MELRQLNKTILIIFLTLAINTFSQVSFSSVKNLHFNVDLKKGNRLINILENEDYKIFYLLDKSIFSSQIKNNINLTAKVNLLYYSKQNNEGLLICLNQGQNISKKSYNKYNVEIQIDKNKLLPYFILVDKNFRYNSLLKYIRIQDFNDQSYKNVFSLQNISNYCKFNTASLNGNIIDEKIDFILQSVHQLKMEKNNENCEPFFIIKDFFPSKL